jgi:galactonate dehydratase
VKIERITPFLVDRCLLVRVYTDAGIVGNGEAGLWAHHRMVYEAINDLAEYYVGKDPTLIEHHFQVVSRNTHFQGAVLSAAISAIDVALWDILGKSLGQPVYQLLGGKVRQRVNTFANVVGNSVEACVESACKNRDAGYTSMRMMPFFSGFEQQPSSKIIDDVVAVVAAVRQAVGPHVDLGVEVHRNLELGDAVVLGMELRPYRLLYYEDPLRPQNTPALKYVSERVNLPLAAGERSYNLYQFKEILDLDAVAYVRPDLSLAGGFTQVKKIAALAEAAFVGVFPHLMGSPLNMAAYVQLDAAIPNYFLQETHTVADRLNEILDQPLEREGGWVIVPDRPGIGVDIREEALTKFPSRSVSITGNFRADGSVAH